MESKRIIRIGRTTFGISLILVGITIIIATFCSIDVLRVTLMFWPTVLIAAGCEILYFSKKENTDIKYDFFGMVLTAIVIFSAFIFSGINYFVNKILYEDEIKNAIIYNNSKKEYSIYKEYSSIKVINNADKKVNVNIIEDREQGVFIKLDGVCRTLSDKERIYNFIDGLSLNISEILEFDDENEILYVNNMISKYDNVNITIHTNNKNNVYLEGSF